KHRVGAVEDDDGRHHAGESIQDGDQQQKKAAPHRGTLAVHAAQRAEIDLEKHAGEPPPLDVVDVEPLEDGFDHTRSSARRKSAVTWPASRTPVSRPNASSSDAVAVCAQIIAAVPSITC